jgi:hypothetical protein
MLRDPFVRKSLYESDLVISDESRVKEVINLLCLGIALFPRPIFAMNYLNTTLTSMIQKFKELI